MSNRRLEINKSVMIAGRKSQSTKVTNSIITVTTRQIRPATIILSLIKNPTILIIKLTTSVSKNALRLQPFL